MPEARPADTARMSLRAGIDLVDVGDIEDALGTHSERYLARIYTPAEIRDCRRAGVIDARRLAARFAAKEAVMKLLDPEPAVAIPWNAIGLEKGACGAPLVVLRGRAKLIAAARGIDDISISFTHHNDVAGAVAFATGREA